MITRKNRKTDDDFVWLYDDDDGWLLCMNKKRTRRNDFIKELFDWEGVELRYNLRGVTSQ